MASKKRELPPPIPIEPGLLEKGNPLALLTPTQMKALTPMESEALFQETFTPYGHQHLDGWASIQAFLMAMDLPGPDEDPSLREEQAPFMPLPSGHAYRDRQEPFDTPKAIDEVVRLGPFAHDLLEEVLEMLEEMLPFVSGALHLVGGDLERVRLELKARFQEKSCAVVVRWNTAERLELPNLCLWCGRPVYGRASDPRTGQRAVFCREACRLERREFFLAKERRTHRGDEDSEV